MLTDQCVKLDTETGHTNGTTNHDTPKNGTQTSPLRKNSLAVYNICELACIFGLISPNK